METNIINAAVDAVNKSKLEAVVDVAQSKIIYISKEKETIAKTREAIKTHQEALQKIAEDVLTPELVLGRGPSLNPTPSEAVILEAIKNRNEAKAKSIAANAKAHTDAVDNYQGTIKACEKRIADMVAEIQKLSAETITAAGILS
jgi:DNA repair exonuclease SbcCD ATPase subunit